MAYLSFVSIDDVIVGLGDLLAVAPPHAAHDRPWRSAALALVDGDAIFRTELTSLHQGLVALPPEQRGVPRRELLKENDAAFDRDGMILRLYQQILALLPSPLPAVASAGASIEALVPLGITREAYSTEAAHAKRIEPTLATHRPALAAIQVPDIDTPDLGAVAARFVASGLELDRLASKSGGEVASRGDRAGAGAIRGRAIGALNALRDHVERAVRVRNDLPRDLDGQIFGYLDELERRAIERAPTKPSDASPPSPTTPAPPEP